jgi:hypothetical protein
MSIYDDIHHEGTSFFYGKLESLNSHEVKRVPEASAIPRRLFYSEANALEDEVLFPEEHSSEGEPQPLAVEKLKRWEEEGFDLMKFVEGWWTDSDEDSSLDSGDSEEDDDDETDKDDETGEDYENGNESLGKDNEQSLDTTNGTIEPLASLPEALKELMDKLIPGSEKREKAEPDMEAEFMDFLDREKARGIFTSQDACIMMH